MSSILESIEAWVNQPNTDRYWGMSVGITGGVSNKLNIHFYNKVDNIWYITRVFQADNPVREERIRRHIYDNPEDLLHIYAKDDENIDTLLSEIFELAKQRPNKTDSQPA